ncbi:DDE-type integrase/transposase/recombinase [Mycobacteroides abscessus]|uniref:DDE-type integrase/transposase/recombinase n=1 Tax=Mycobacteroides abscessus TaxID=36809 RepID=UPI000C264937
MKRTGLRGLPGVPRRRKPNNEYLFTSSDLVDRDFTATVPNQLWCIDVTEHPTREGKVYCCAVIDACSRKVVGWAIDS